MEVGAVKQAFNNEVILLKKKLNQAKIQIIHKLTRKAKTLTEKKAPEHLKDKNKRKAESAVLEVLLIKKIKPKDLAKFIITHEGELKDLLNKPKVDHSKACTRLLLHKALENKYTFIRNRFRDVPIKDLFMSRQERLKVKKEAREKQKNKKKGKANAESEWKVEDVEMPENDDAKQLTDEEESDKTPNSDDDQRSEGSNNDKESGDNDDDSLIDRNDSLNSIHDNDSVEEEHLEPNAVNSDAGTREKLVKFDAKNKPIAKNIPKNNTLGHLEKKLKTKPDVKKPDKKFKENKNKNINEKILKRQFKKETKDEPVLEKKVVDPFFITESGDNYMSVAEPRQPDEVKEVHKEGNRKLRRAVMFGHVRKPKPRYNYGRDNSQQDRYGKKNGYVGHRFDDRGSFNDKSKSKERTSFHGGEKANERGKFDDRHAKFDSDVKPEKLHPSWEAKKRQSGILPFQGKKTVFNES